MKKLRYLSSKGQTALEYLLLCGLVAFVVFAAFGNGGFLRQVKTSSNTYYGAITNVIMGDDVEPINGGWCSWSLCTNGVQFRTCECPAPAFGGKCYGCAKQDCAGSCLDSTVAPTPPGPRVCAQYDNCTTGACVCPAGMTCNTSTTFICEVPIDTTGTGGGSGGGGGEGSSGP